MLDRRERERSNCVGGGWREERRGKMRDGGGNEGGVGEKMKKNCDGEGAMEEIRCKKD